MCQPRPVSERLQLAAPVCGLYPWYLQSRQSPVCAQIRWDCACGHGHPGRHPLGVALLAVGKILVNSAPESFDGFYADSACGSMTACCLTAPYACSHGGISDDLASSYVAHVAYPLGPYSEQEVLGGDHVRSFPREPWSLLEGVALAQMLVPEASRNVVAMHDFSSGGFEVVKDEVASGVADADCTQVHWELVEEHPEISGAALGVAPVELRV